MGNAASLIQFFQPFLDLLLGVQLVHHVIPAHRLRQSFDQFARGLFDTVHRGTSDRYKDFSIHVAALVALDSTRTEPLPRYRVSLPPVRTADWPNPLIADQRCAVAAAFGSDTAQPAPRALYTATKEVAVSVRLCDSSSSALKAVRSASRTSRKSINPPSNRLRAKSAALSLAAAASCRASRRDCERP